MKLEDFETYVRPFIPLSFSDEHVILLQICFGDRTPSNSAVEPLSEEELTYVDLRRLYHMVQVEFEASFRKEMKGGDETTTVTPKPKPYDVFLIETTGDNIAVCLPLRKEQKLCWYNGKTELIDLDRFTPKWRIASLSGTARILQALAAPKSSLSNASMQRNLLIDPDEDFGDTLSRLPFDDDLKRRICDLNESQQQALATVVNNTFKEGFFPIQGPPGCGKTSVLVAMIAALDKGILVVAPSNAAVANIALKVYNTGRFQLNEISVYGENADPMIHFLQPRLRGEKFVSFKNSMEVKDCLVSELVDWLHLDGVANDYCMKDLEDLCTTFNMETREGRNKFNAHLGQSKVVFATLNSAASTTLSQNLRVHTLLLDEAGQTPEAEFFIATQFPGIGKIVVVGDPQQLPATVIDHHCKSAGHGISWLGKIQGLFPRKVHLLNTQYRMDPEILKFPNQTFYRGLIMSGDIVFARQPRVEHPFLLVDTARQGSEEKDGFSFQNSYEVAGIIAILTNDVDIKSLMQGSCPIRIIVISPYRSQVKLLKMRIPPLKNCTLDISTVDSFQGKEGDVVILSTVRTKNIGFVDDQQRLNVALTRAKRILRVVGDASFFLKLPDHSKLRKLCEFTNNLGFSQKTSVRPSSWSKPNWDEPRLWKPLANQRFFDCVQKMSAGNCNICFNTLHAVATPQVNALGSMLCKRDTPSWNTSYLKRYSAFPLIVWIAKQINEQIIIEAHFAGSRDACNRFVQKHAIPSDALPVK